LFVFGTRCPNLLPVFTRRPAARTPQGQKAFLHHVFICRW
jgi:hypothetical protein